MGYSSSFCFWKIFQDPEEKNSNLTTGNESELSNNLSTPFINNQDINIIEKDTSTILVEERAMFVCG